MITTLLGDLYEHLKNSVVGEKNTISPTHPQQQINLANKGLIVIFPVSTDWYFVTDLITENRVMLTVYHNTQLACSSSLVAVWEQLKTFKSDGCRSNCVDRMLHPSLNESFNLFHGSISVKFYKDNGI